MERMFMVFLYCLLESVLAKALLAVGGVMRISGVLQKSVADIRTVCNLSPMMLECFCITNTNSKGFQYVA